MKERDYIIASDLARVRSAKNVLRDVTPDCLERDLPIPAAEYRFIMRGLTAWEHRLHRLMSRGEVDKEPWLREWPTMEKGG
jgi:hypothetical protein